MPILVLPDGSRIQVAVAPKTKAEARGMIEQHNQAQEMKLFTLTERRSPKVYKDTGQRDTVGIGFNMERGDARSIWKTLKIVEDFDQVKNGSLNLSEKSIDELFRGTVAPARELAKTRSKNLGVDFQKLPVWHQTILTDLAFNVKDITQFKKVFTNTAPHDVLREARRQDGGKNTKGMDNRVTKIGMSLGLIKDNKEAINIGLKLSTFQKEGQP